jgi:hypothetical protein
MSISWPANRTVWSTATTPWNLKKKSWSLKVPQSRSMRPLAWGEAPGHHYVALIRNDLHAPETETVRLAVGISWLNGTQPGLRGAGFTLLAVVQRAAGNASKPGLGGGCNRA